MAIASPNGDYCAQVMRQARRLREIYDPKTFLAAVAALFEQRTIGFTDGV